MAAAVGNCLGHDVSTDIVGWLYVVIYIGIHRVTYQAICNNLPTRWQWASSSASELSAQQPPRHIGHCAASSGQQHHWGMKRGGGGNKIGGIRPGDRFSYMMGLRASIDHGSHRCPTATMGPHSRLLSIQQSVSILWNRSKLLKLEKTIIINVF